MMNRKSIGSNDISAEIWKMLGKPGAEFLAILVNHICLSKFAYFYYNAYLLRATSCMNKNHNCADLEKHGGYQQLFDLSAYLTSMSLDEDHWAVINSQLGSIVTLSPNQYSFLKGCNITNAIHAICLLMEKQGKIKKTVHGICWPAGTVGVEGIQLSTSGTLWCHMKFHNCI